MTRLLAVGVVVLATGALVAAPAPPAGEKAPDAGRFVHVAVLNGLAEDGVPPALAAELAKRADFVPKCGICAMTHKALNLHAGLTDVPAAKDGKGLPAELVKRLKSNDVAARQPALRELVQGYIVREYARLDLTAAPKAALQKELEEMRKAAMGGLKAGQKFCPSCDGACRRTPKL